MPPTFSAGTPLDSHDFSVLGRVSLLSGLHVFPQGLEHALEALRIGAGADCCELFLLDDAGEELLLTGCAGPDSAEFCTRERFDIGEGFPGIIAQRATLLSSRELPTDPRFLRGAVTSRGYATFAGVPMLRSGQVLGTLHLAWKSVDAPLKRGLRLLDAARLTFTSALLSALVEPGATEPMPGNDLLRLASRFRQAGDADAATIIMLDAATGAIAGCRSTGRAHVMCDQMSTQDSCDCPNDRPQQRGVVLRGRRSQWPAPCRTLPRGFQRIVEIPLTSAGQTLGRAFLGYERDPAGPSTHHMGKLLALARTSGVARPPAPRKPPTLHVVDEPRLRLQCFGPFTVFIDGRLISRREFRRAKAIELLQLLVLHEGRPVSRDALVEQLWPNAGLTSGARSLHVAMHALRRAIEPRVQGRQWVHIQTLDDSFFFDLNSSCSVDMVEFRRLIALARGSDEEAGAMLGAAVSLYRGALFADVLEGDWLLSRREGLRNDYLEAVLRLAELTNRPGSRERSCTLLRQACELEPTREDLHRRLIHSLWNTGQKAAARRSYDACVRLLRSELGVPVGPETLRLGKLIGAG